MAKRSDRHKGATLSDWQLLALQPHSAPRFTTERPALQWVAAALKACPPLVNRTIAVAMSGGVDSSVVAGMLHAGGDNVVGLTMQLWLERTVLNRIPGSRINGAGAPRTPNTSNIRFDGIDSEALLIALDLRGFAASSGAACSSGASEPSHVLLAIGLTKEQARSSMRFSLGRSNNADQVDLLLDALVECVAHLRKLSPTYV